MKEGNQVKKLAIVIPAYKGVFFEETLRSLAGQTVNDFNVYVGDDNSPDPIKDIVSGYKGKLNIFYKHFEDNLGGHDLVAQWERCIDLVQDETWVWLFSDDDILHPDCVKMFFESTLRYPGHDLYHFDVKVINEQGRETGQSTSFASSVSSEELIDYRLNKGSVSYVVEYVFRKSHFLNSGRFVKFDLAWGTDDATWIKLASEKGIRNIENAHVYWRRSSYNITPNYKDINLLVRKLNAQVDFADWLMNNANALGLNVEIQKLETSLSDRFVRSLKSRIEILPGDILRNLIMRYKSLLSLNRSPGLLLLYLGMYRIYKKLKTLAKRILFIKPKIS